MSPSKPERDPLVLYNDPAELRALGNAMLPFLREIGTSAKGKRIRYNRRRVTQLLVALRDGYFMRAVEADPNLPYDMKIMAANATTSMAKFGSFVLKGVESTGFDDFVKFVFFAKDRIDRIVAFLEIEAHSVSELEKKT